MKSLRWDFYILYSSLKTTKIIFIIININILRDTNSICIYSVTFGELNFTGNRKQNVISLVKDLKCTSAVGELQFSWDNQRFRKISLRDSFDFGAL